MSEFDKLAPWRVLDTRRPIDNRFLTIREIDYELPNGHQMTDYYVADKSDVAVVVPYRDGKTYLIKEWERGIGDVGYKFPAGRVDPGETPERAGMRELEEETGLRALGIISLGVSHVEPGFMTTKAHHFLCTDFEEGDGKVEDPKELFVGEWVEFEAVGNMILHNEIKNPFVIVSYMYAQNVLAGQHAHDLQT